MLRSMVLIYLCIYLFVGLSFFLGHCLERESPCRDERGGGVIKIQLNLGEINTITRVKSIIFMQEVVILLDLI